MLFQACEQCGTLVENLVPITIIVEGGASIRKEVCVECSAKNRITSNENILLG